MANFRKRRRKKQRNQRSPNHCPLARAPRLLRCERLEDRRMLAVVMVDTHLDTVDFTDSVTSLREAIFATNLVGGADTINFDPSLAGKTILLTQGELAITDSLTINGLGADQLTIDASGNDPTPDSTPLDDDFSDDGDGSRVFRIESGIPIEYLLDGATASDQQEEVDNENIVTISGLTLTGGDAESGGAIATSAEELTIIDVSIRNNVTSNLGDGGGILAYGPNSLLILSSSIVGNVASGSGGGVHVEHASLGQVLIYDTSIDSNSARSGGGIWSQRTDMLIESSSILDNIARERDGGGILFIAIGSGSLTVDSSTISGNTAGDDGGGIDFDSFRTAAGEYSGNFTLKSSTVSGNAAIDVGGGIAFNHGLVALHHSTITDNNSADYGGGVAGGTWYQLDVLHTIIAGNSALEAADFTPHAFLDGGSSPLTISASFIGDNSASGLSEAPVGSPDANDNIIGGPINGVIDALLAPLADNGGSTLTHALLPGSPAINAGDLNAVAGVDGVPEFDQRGASFDRIYSGRIDIGAYEVQELSDLNLVVDTLEDESDGDYSRFDLSLREAIELANANPLPDTINFDPTLAGGTILLTMGELAITDSLTINGLGAELLTIDASGNDSTPGIRDGMGSRIFDVDDGDSSTEIDVEIRDLTLTGGDVLGNGGAIISQEILSVVSSTISGNSAGEDGGGIWDYTTTSTEPTTITGSTISDNSAGFDGGGVWIFTLIGTTEITESVFFGNSAGQLGGGILASGTTTISNSMIFDNQAADDGGGIVGGGSTTIIESTITNNSAGEDGGGFRTAGTAMIADSTFAGNTAGGEGGGFRAGITTITGSTISENFADSNGGGFTASSANITGSVILDNLAGFDGGGFRSNFAVTISKSTIGGNSAGVNGGGVASPLFRYSELTITDSTISDNSAGESGGGIAARGPATITNSTISGNRANASGGGIFIGNSSSLGSDLLAINHSTIARNTSDVDLDDSGFGGGVFLSQGTLLLDHSILATNADQSGIGPDLTGILGVTLDVHFSLVGNNLGTGLEEAPVGSPDSDGNLIGGPINGIIDPMLGTLADNGGPTFTLALLLFAGSPAIDAGDPSLLLGVDGTPEFDQRGAPFGRVVGGRIDIGAYEVQPAAGSYHGDFDLDGDKDGIDFLFWQRGFGILSGATLPDGDATGDGDVDGNDEAVWEATFGEETVELSAISGQLSAEVGVAAQRRAELVDAAVAAEMLFDRELNKKVSVPVTKLRFDFELLQRVDRQIHFQERTSENQAPKVEQLLQASSAPEASLLWSDKALPIDAIDEVFAQL